MDNEFGDIYDYVAYFHAGVLTTYECGIDQLPDDEREDVIRDLFSEWV